MRVAVPLCEFCGYPAFLHTPSGHNVLKCLYAHTRYKPHNCESCGRSYLYWWVEIHKPLLNYQRQLHLCTGP